MEKTYEVKGMTCVICKANVEKALNKTSGVNNAVVNLLDNEVTIDFDETKVNETTLEEVVDKAGYKLLLNKEKKLNKDKLYLIISIILSIILMCLSMMKMDNSIDPDMMIGISLNQLFQMILASIVIMINIHTFKSGFKALSSLSPNMDSLVALSSTVSFIYSIYALYKINLGDTSYHLYFETAAMTITIVKLGKYIEGNTKAKTTKIIRGLTTLIPMNAHLLKDGKEELISINDLKKDDIVIIKPGESVPRDGVIINGSSSIDESMITGESLPVNKTIGDEVIGGTTNTLGTINVQVTKSASTTVLSKIINLTKKASNEKIPVERFADNISKYFVFTVIGISLITFIIWMIISKTWN